MFPGLLPNDQDVGAGQGENPQQPFSRQLGIQRYVALFRSEDAQYPRVSREAPMGQQGDQRHGGRRRVSNRGRDSPGQAAQLLIGVNLAVDVQGRP